jgi:site-specific DNA-methyltransferase (adenine-specific)
MKPNCMPESVSDRPTRSHEYLFLLAKSARYYYDADAIREPVSSKRGGLCFGKQRFNASGTGAQSRRLRSAAERSHPLGRDKRSVWTVSTHSFHGAHFALFPPNPIRPCVRAGSPVGGTVLDPFAGSGTTGMVAEQEG